MTLETLIRKLIRANGPIDIAALMALAAQHPKQGYYRSKPAVGAAADFVTAPEISQIFGEFVGLCLVSHWLDNGADKRAHLAELGPGRGTMMLDMLRAIDRVGGEQLGATVELVESNEILRQIQSERFRDREFIWHADVTGLSEDRPLYIAANEFLDSLPMRQFVNVDDSWQERVVTLEDDRLAFSLVPANPVLSQIAEQRCNALQGNPVADGKATVIELSPAREAVVASLAERVAVHGGAVLIIDYGEKNARDFGDSLQAVREHARRDPLVDPGENDLTSLVDFGALIEVASLPGLRLQGPREQGDFLAELGGAVRLNQLLRGSDQATHERIRQSYERLVDKEQMGRLFKVMAITRQDQTPLAGFGDD